MGLKQMHGMATGRCSRRAIFGPRVPRSVRVSSAMPHEYDVATIGNLCVGAFIFDTAGDMHRAAACASWLALLPNPAPSSIVTPPDILVDVPELPAVKDTALLDRLAATAAADTSRWEVGGNSNFALAAARLGLDVAWCVLLGPILFYRETRDRPVCAPGSPRPAIAVWGTSGWTPTAGSSRTSSNRRVSVWSMT